MLNPSAKPLSPYAPPLQEFVKIARLRLQMSRIGVPPNAEMQARAEGKDPSAVAAEVCVCVCVFIFVLCMCHFVVVLFRTVIRFVVKRQTTLCARRLAHKCVQKKK